MNINVNNNSEKNLKKKHNFDTPSCLLTNILYAFLVFPTCIMCPTPLILDMATLISSFLDYGKLSIFKTHPWFSNGLSEHVRVLQ